MWINEIYKLSYLRSLLLMNQSLFSSLGKIIFSLNLKSVSRKC